MASLEPLLLIHNFKEFAVGDYVTVDGQPAVIRKIKSNTGTVLSAEIEVYESREARAEANPK